MLSDKIIDQSSCMLCGLASKADCIYSSRDTKRAKDETYHYLRCQNCGLAYLSPKPKLSQEMYDEYYESLLPSNVIDNVMKLLYISNCCNFVEKKSGGKGRILDIGCGNGDFLVAMKKRQWDVYGIEASRLAGERANKVISDDRIIITNSLRYGFADESFDVITLWHVLEHVEYPMLLMNEIHRLLKRNGVTIIEVPNANISMYRIFGEYHYMNSVPEHLFLWSREAIRLLLNKSGLEIEDIMLFQKSRFALSRNIYRLVKSRYGEIAAAALYLLSAPISLANKYFGVLGGKKDLIRVVCRKK